jgi:hypothetical protein
VEDVPVLSARRLGAHFAYWDKGCESMRYILEEIEPDLFGGQVHQDAACRK